MNCVIPIVKFFGWLYVYMIKLSAQHIGVKSYSRQIARDKQMKIPKDERLGKTPPQNLFNDDRGVRKEGTSPEPNQN